MFLMGMIFLLILLLTFGIVLLVTRPTATERSIDQRISNLRSEPVGTDWLEQQNSEIVKHTRLSEVPWLDSLLRRWSVVHKIHLMIEQAQRSWSVPKVLASSAALALAGYGMDITRCQAQLSRCCPRLPVPSRPFCCCVISAGST
jgi:hypothetical protein